GAKSSEAIIANWWRQGMMGGAKAHYDGIVAFSQTDFTEDLKKISVPVLVMHVIPGLGGLGHRLVLEWQRGIARHGVEAPGERAGFGIIGGDIAAHAILPAAVADHDASLDDSRRLRDGVGLRWIDRHDGPDGLAGTRIERHQSAVEGGDEDLALPRGDTATDDVAAAPDAERAGHRRIVGPE